MLKVLNDPFKKRLFVSYLYDWILVIIMTVAFFAIDKIPPFHRMFSLEDKTIMFPYTEKESVPVWLLLIICFLVPLIIISCISLSGYGYKRNFYDFHCGILGLCLGLAMTIMLTDVIKVSVGRPRPDMLSRCQPPPDAVDPLFGLSNVTICTTDIYSHEMIDGFKSFPSGHSSFSFAGLCYLAFYIAGKMRMFDEKGYTYKGFLFAFPIIGALLVAISRTEDYRHHWQDVTVGALLGTFCSYFAYRQYYPSLSNSSCTEPYLTRFDFWKKFIDEELGVSLVESQTIHGSDQNISNKYQQDDFSDESQESSPFGRQPSGSNHYHYNDRSMDPIDLSHSVSVSSSTPLVSQKNV